MSKILFGIVSALALFSGKPAYATNVSGGKCTCDAYYDAVASRISYDGPIYLGRLSLIYTNMVTGKVDTTLLGTFAFHNSDQALNACYAAISKTNICN